ncbi:MAG TPA: hypothetical protein VFY56_03815 [Propionibacteriaceae bacterium]|nr:hypothetical protein [Propionibacteriaceae bacterium]
MGKPINPNGFSDHFMQVGLLAGPVPGCSTALAAGDNEGWLGGRGRRLLIVTALTFDA